MIMKDVTLPFHVLMAAVDQIMVVFMVITPCNKADLIRSFGPT